MTANGRVPPHDLDAEASVIGSILLDPGALLRVLDFLAAEDFYRPNNGLVYRAAVDLFREGEAVDSLTLAARLETAGALDRIGGRSALAMLQEQTPTAANVEHYGRIVKDRALKRGLRVIGNEVVALGDEESISGEEAVNRAQAKVYSILDGRSGSRMVAVADLLADAMGQVDAQMANPGLVVGLPTGLMDLDRVLGGLKHSELIVMAGRPSMGKSALAGMVGLEVAKQGHPVAIFSLEMSRESLVARFLCQEARIDIQRLQRGMINEREYEALVESAGTLGELPIYIDDTPGLDELSLMVRARQAKARNAIELVIVDYLGLLHAHGSDGRNRVQDVSTISASLKDLSRELRIPVIAVSQLSRSPEQRPDKRPILSDLRDSGSQEQDADVVLLLYRDDYYNLESEKPGIAEVIVAKHRNGPTGTVELVFRKELTRFENLERRQLGEGS